MADIHPDASVAPTAVVTGDVTIGAGSRVLHGAVLNGDNGPITLGEDVLVMENAVLRGRVDHPLTIGDAVLVGPHAHVNGARIEDEVFLATGVSVFAGAVVGAGSELRINSVLHVNSTLPPGSVVPIGWIAAGDPAQLFPPERHDELWAVQEGLDFPGTMYGVPRGTSMREIMRQQSETYAQPKVSTRRTVPADADRLAEIATAAYEGYLERMGGVRPAPMDADYAHAVEHHTVWVAEVDGEVAGFVVLVDDPMSTLLENVAVEPSRQGHGVGKVLLALAEDHARSTGRGTIRLYTHATMTENRRLYARHGYVETGQRDEDGFDRVFLEKRV